MRLPGGGRPRKSDKIREAEGHRGHSRPLSQRELMLPPTEPKCPSFLIGEGRKMWTRVVRCMLDHGTVQVEDGALLAAYCQAWGMLCAAASALNKLTVDDQLGDKGARLRRIIRESNDRIEKCTMHLGLNPSDQSKTPRGRTGYAGYPARRNHNPLSR